MIEKIFCFEEHILLNLFQREREGETEGERETTHPLKKVVGGGGGTNQPRAEVQPRRERWRRRALRTEDAGGIRTRQLVNTSRSTSIPIPSHDDCDSGQGGTHQVVVARAGRLASGS
jgi:hypothetical protein